MSDMEATYEPTEFERAWHHSHMCDAGFAAVFPQEVADEREARDRRRKEVAAYNERVKMWARTEEATPFIERAYSNSFPAFQ
jgi:hypothetical protein